jgi:hypothetical protein
MSSIDGVSICSNSLPSSTVCLLLGVVLGWSCAGKLEIGWLLRSKVSSCSRSGKSVEGIVSSSGGWESCSTWKMPSELVVRGFGYGSPCLTRKCQCG